MLRTDVLQTIKPLDELAAKHGADDIIDWLAQQVKQPGSDFVGWFEDKGLKLVVEPDGRMFPVSNKSADVINCLQNAANNVGVTLRRHSSVINLKDLGSDGFAIKCRDGTNILANKIISCQEI